MVRGILLETSHATAEIALADDTGILYRQVLASSERHVRDLAPTLATLLAEGGWKPSEVDMLIVDLGPGSYTGLRTGVVTAKAFAYAAGAKVVGVEAMRLVAAGAPNNHLKVSAIVDAQQGNVYAQDFGAALPEGDREPMGPIRVIPATEWANGLDRETYVTGPALARFQELLSEDVPRAPIEASGPTVDVLRRLGWKKFLRGETEDLWGLEPLYLRASSAEIKWNKRLSAKEETTRE